VSGRGLLRILVVEDEATVLRALDVERARIECDNRLVVGRHRERVEVATDHRGEQVDVALEREGVLEMFAGAARELGTHIHHVHRAARLHQLARECAAYRARSDDQDVNLKVLGRSSAHEQQSSFLLPSHSRSTRTYSDEF